MDQVQEHIVILLIIMMEHYLLVMVDKIIQMRLLVILTNSEFPNLLVILVSLFQE